MIKIEVTGDNAAEVLAQLRVLAGLAEGPVAETTQTEVVLENKPTVGTEAAKRTRKAKGNDAPTADGTGTTTTTTAEESPAVVSETPTEVETVSAAADLDFDTDVAPKVLAAVQKAGKPAVTELLAEFGVERASQLEADRWPELVERLADLG